LNPEFVRYADKIRGNEDFTSWLNLHSRGYYFYRRSKRHAPAAQFCRRCSVVTLGEIPRIFVPGRTFDSGDPVGDDPVNFIFGELAGSFCRRKLAETRA
jgi:hypothetical protein